MPLATRAGLDTAGGGLITALGQAFVRVDGLLLAVVGDPLADHGAGIHNAATMAAGSALVTVDGIPVCRLGDPATCGHTATGSGHVSIDS